MANIQVSHPALLHTRVIDATTGEPVQLIPGDNHVSEQVFDDMQKDEVLCRYRDAGMLTFLSRRTAAPEPTPPPVEDKKPGGSLFG